MPELPEVETVRRVLTRELKGRTLTSVLIGRPTFYRRPPAKRLRSLVGKPLTNCRRRGKFLLLDFQGEDSPLLLHLGMSGRLFFAGVGENVAKQKHCRLELGFGKRRLRFIDPRRFGRVGCELPAKFGPEPLEGEFTPEYLYRNLRSRKTQVKAALLDQGFVAGIGNIYATEALYLCGIRPQRPSGRVSRDESRRLHRAIRRVLSRGIELGGSTLNDRAFLDPHGKDGKAQDEHSIYGRRHAACGHALAATSRPISGRTSVYCPRCQL